MRKQHSVTSLAYVLVTVLMLIGGFAQAAAAAKPEQIVPSNAHFNINDYAGKIVYVDFWASWCGPCRQSFPFMNALQAQFPDELAIVAINVDESKDDALAFLEAFDPQFDIVYDPEGELASGFDVPGMPTSYLFDRNGKLLKRHIGFKRSQIDELGAAIASAVSELINEKEVVAEND